MLWHLGLGGVLPRANIVHKSIGTPTDYNTVKTLIKATP